MVKAQVPNPTALEQLALYPTLIVHNANIYSMDEKLSSYQALAVRGSRIWRLGTNDAIRRFAGPQTRMIDARGRTLLPGLFDVHSHVALAAISHGWKYDKQLRYLWVEGETLDEVKSRLRVAVKQRIQESGSDQWVLAVIPYQFEAAAVNNGGISSAELDRIAPATPLSVLTGILNGTVNNTVARRAMEEVLGKEVNNYNFLYLVPYEVILKGKVKQISEMLAAELAEYVPLGITSILDNISSPQLLRSLNHLDRQGSMSIRWAWIHRMGFALGKNPAEFYSLLGDLMGQGSEHFWLAGISEDGWDLPFCTSAVPRTPESRERQRALASQGCQYEGGRIYEGQVAALRSGLRLLGSYVPSDRGFEALVESTEEFIREEVMTLEEIRKAGWGLEFGYMLRPDQAPLAAKYGFWMNFSPTQITREEDVLQNYGEKYIPWVAPVKAWFDAGARFALGSSMHIPLSRSLEDLMADRMLYKARDYYRAWPDEWRNSVWPYLGVWMTREINHKVYSAEKKLDRTTVMKAWTIWPAEQTLRKNDLGSLEPGKLADFIVIDKDYFSIPETEIQNIKTLMTVIAGQVKFQAADF